jgi:hypothetical protein
MEYLLFLFIVIIVITTGYVLSKPFSKQMDQPEETRLLDHERQYQNLLEEIRGIEKDCESGILTTDDCIRQIREKKEIAANLLRVIDPTMRIESVISDEFKPTEPDHAQLTAPFLSQGSYYCPQCGDQVKSSDKFCMHCGHRLQP